MLFQLKFHIIIFHLHFQAQVLPVSPPPILFPVVPGSNFAHGDAATSSGDFRNLKNKHCNVEFAPQMSVTPSDSIVTKFITFHRELIRATFTSGDVIR